MSDALASLQHLRQDPTSTQHQLSLANELHQLFQEGLVGNRAVSAGDVWGIVTAATRAFPIQLSPSLDKTREVLQAGAAASDLLHTWFIQAAADGSLAVLIHKLSSQPQILTAYARDAPIRQAATAEKLVAALQELQVLIPVSPHDRYLQAKAAAAAPPALPPVYIQTELDLLPPPQQQQQQQQQSSPLTSPPSSTSGSKAGSSSGSSSSTAASSSSGSDHVSNADSTARGNSQQVQQQQQQPVQQQQGLVGRLRSARLPQLGSFTRSKEPPQQQQQQPHEDVRLLQVQLQVVQQLSCPGGRLVQLHIQHVSPQSPKQQQHHIGKKLLHKPGPNSSNSSSKAGDQGQPAASAASSGRLHLGGESVKGMLQGLQQSATSGIQQSAAATAAAGQELVAAAGGAVAAAISSPFVAVKGFNRFRSTGKKQAAATAPGGEDGDAEGCQPDSINSGQSSGHGSPGSTAASDIAAKAAAAAAAAGPSMTQDNRLLCVLLHVCDTHDIGVADAACIGGPVKLELVLLPAAQQQQQQQQTSGAKEGWSTRVLLDRLRRTRGGSASSSRTSPHQQEQSVLQAASIPQQQQEQQQRSLRQQQQEQEPAEALLDGDRWSVMSRLKSASNMLSQKPDADTPVAAAAAAEGGGADQQQSSVADRGADTAAAAMVAQQLQQAGSLLQQQLVGTCEAVCAAAAATKGCLGEECAELLLFIEHIKGLLNHGLNSSGSSSTTPGSSSNRGSTPEPGGSTGGVAAAVKAAATARDMLGGFLGRQQSAFGVLQALQHGGKQQPRLMLGADGIANMRSAKSTPPSAKLDLWVRASLNEQLLGVRISTLLSNPDALRPWYHPQALLLQHGSMTAVMQQLMELSQHKFALPVETYAPAAAAAAAASRQLADAGVNTAAGDAGTATSSKASSMASAMDPRRYLGGLSVGLGPLRVSSTTAAPAAAGDVTAAAVTGPTGAAAVPGPGSNGSVGSIPTFLWGAISMQGTPATATAGTAASAATAASAGGFFRRRRVVQIRDLKEVKVPAPGAAPSLSREPSSTLSPMSTEDDVAYAEWWSPNNSSQDIAATAGAAMAGSGSGGGSGGGSAAEGSGSAVQAHAHLQARRPSSSGSLASLGSGRVAAQGWDAALGEASSGTPRSPAATAAAAEGVSAVRPGSRLSRADSVSSTGATSAAALRLEQELQAAMSAPLLVEQLSTRSSGSSSGGGSAGVSVGRSSTALRKANSAGWDAAVAAARARSHGGSGGGSHFVAGSSMGLSAGAFAHLSRRSRSPDPPVCSNGRAGSGSGSGRRGRHMHKRSSSLNDLPELEALWMDGSR